MKLILKFFAIGGWLFALLIVGLAGGSVLGFLAASLLSLLCLSAGVVWGLGRSTYAGVAEAAEKELATKAAALKAAEESNEDLRRAYGQRLAMTAGELDDARQALTEADLRIATLRAGQPGTGGQL